MTIHSTSQPPAIRVEGLTRTFGTNGNAITAVNGLDLTVEPGELIAFLGPNGAGKSTTLRMLTTLLSPTDGHAQVAGYDVCREASHVRGIIGYVGQGNGAGHFHHGRDELMGQGFAHGMRRAQTRRRVEELSEVLELDGLLDRKVSTLSGGQRRRLDVAIGLMHDPQVLFLDEPSTGLDPQNRANMQGQIRRMHRDSGATVVLTTHYLEEADALAERVVIIDHGRVIADDSADALKARLGDRISLTVADRDVPGTRSLLAGATDDPDSVEVTGNTVRARIPEGRARLVGILGALSTRGITPEGVALVPSTLDDVFLALTGRRLRDGATSTPRLDDTEEPA